MAHAALNCLRLRCEEREHSDLGKMSEHRQLILEKLRMYLPPDAGVRGAQWCGQVLDAWDGQCQCGYWLHFGTTRLGGDHLMAAMLRWNFLIRHGKGVKSLELEVARRGKMLKY